MARQVLVVHGGDTFDTREAYLEFLRSWTITKEDLVRTPSWKSNLAKELGLGYEVIQPGMPCAGNARYEEWKIWFEKYLPLLSDEIILLGHSLGGIFLAKYLSEERIGKTVLATLLVAPPYGAGPGESLADFELPESLLGIAEQGGRVVLYFSSDDTVVPYANLARYRAALPYAQVRTFSDRGHFIGESFPEIVEDIRALG